MSDRDVKLVIRAKNEASREIKSLTGDLDDFTKSQKDAVAPAGKLDKLIGELGKEFAALDNTLKASQTLQKVGGLMDRAARGVANLEGELTSATQKVADASSAFILSTERVTQLTAAHKGLIAEQQRLKGELDSARESTKRGATAQKELTEAQKAYNAARRAKVGTQGRDEAIVQTRMDLELAKAATDANRMAVDSLAARYSAASRELKALGADLTKATREQSAFENASRESEARQEKVAASLTKAREEYGQMGAEVREFASSLGIASTEQTELTASIARLVPEAERLARVMNAMNRYSTGTGFADPKVADSLRRQRVEIDKTKDTWKTLEAEAGRMAQQMKSSVNPTERQTQAFKEITSAARAAKAEYEAQVAALGKMAGNARSTFAEFVRGSASLDSVNAAISRNRANVDALGEALGRYSTGTGGIADPKTAAAMRTQAAAVEAAQQRWKLLNTEAQKLAAIMQSSGSATAQQTQRLRELVSAANAAEKEFDDLSKAMTRMQVATGDGSIFSRMGRESRQAMSVYQRLRGEVLSLATAYIGLYGSISAVGGVVTAFQSLEAAQNRLGAVFAQNESKVGQELQWLESQAARLGIEFGTLSDQYSKFAVSANAANFSAEATRRIFMSVAEAGRVNKLSLEDMNGIFLALTQMIQKGRISSEELRQQMGERLPGAINIMADALGVTTAELAKMMEQGQVLADQTNLLKFADQLDKRFGPQLAKSLTSTTTLLGKFFNNLFQAQLLVANGGFIEKFNDLLESMNKYFESREGRDFFLSIGSALGSITSVVTSFVENIEAVKTIITGLVAIRVTGWAAGIIGRFGELAKSAAESRTKVAASQSQLNLFSKQTDQNVKSLSVFNAGIRQSFDQLRSSTSVASAWSAATVAGTSAIRASVISLSSVMGAAANIARGMWAAIGGWAGIALTAVTSIATYMLGSWATGVSEVTKYLDEHQQLMVKVQEAYDKVDKSTANWKDNLKGISVDALVKDVREGVKQFNTLRQQFEMPDIWRGRGDATYKQLQSLVQAFKTTRISARDLRVALEGLYESADTTYWRQIIEGMLDSAREMENVANSAGEAAYAARDLGKNIDEVQQAIHIKGWQALDEELGNVAKALNENTTAFDAAETAASRYKTALEGLADFVPELKDELDRLADIKSLQEVFKNIPFNEITPELVRQAREGMKNINQEFIDSRMKGSLVSRIIGVESGGNANARNPNSSAAGLGQFIDSTWLKMFKKYFPTIALELSDSEILSKKTDADYSRRLTEAYAEENAAYLQKFGIAINDANVYLAHFLGPEGARKLLSAAPGTSTSQVLGADQIAANRSILEGKTVEQVVAWAEKKMGMSERELELSEEIVKKNQKLLEEKEKQALATQESLAGLGLDVENQKLILAGKEREAAIEEGLAKLRKENPDISDADLERARTLLGQQYDLKNQKSEIEQIDKRINELEQHRNALLEQRKAYEEQGNVAKVEEVDAQLQGVNAQLQQAIQQAIAFHQAIGGPSADASIAKLQSMQLGIQNVGQKSLLTAQQVNTSFADGLVGAFDKMAQAIANGENALQALGDALLQFVAESLIELGKLILRWALLRMLEGMGFGGAIAGMVNGVTVGRMHDGGIAGSATDSTVADPAWFRNARRMHGGGIVGLKSNEVPTILEEGETVRTEEQEAALSRRGGQGGESSPQNIKIVNAFDAGQVMSEALNTDPGERAILNWMGKNSGTIKEALGV